MDLSRLRRGELVAAIGGLVLLLALLFLNWYDVAELRIETPIGDVSAGAELGAWDGQGPLGTLGNLVILAAGVAAVGLALLTAGSRTVALPVAAGALTTALGVGAVVMVLARMLFQPFQDEFVDLKLGIFVALFGAVGIAYGGWQSLQEEAAAPGEPPTATPPADSAFR